MAALDEFKAYLEAQGGRLGAEQADLAIAVLRDYLEAGAPQGRGLRGLTRQFRPADPVGVDLSYLFVIVTDAATHAGRNQPVVEFARSDSPLAPKVQELVDILTSEAYAEKVGWRPARRGDKPPQA
ncbi:hypothetical protein D3C87_1145170 [compost metagenome]